MVRYVRNADSDEAVELDRDQQEAEISPIGRKPSLLGHYCFPQHFDDARLHLTHDAALAGDVGGEERGRPAGGSHCSGTPASRMPSSMS